MTREEFYQKAIISAQAAHTAGLTSAARALERIAESSRMCEELPVFSVKTESKLMPRTACEMIKSNK